MLSLALADKYDLPPPAYTNNPDSNDFIGHPKHTRKYDHTPRLASSHTIPHPLLKLGATHGLLQFPPYVILVRDIRAALVSNYIKHEKRYQISFSDFIRGNPAGDKHRPDIWWHIRFCNGWGKLRRLCPKQSMLIHYEQLTADPLPALEQINSLLQLELSRDNLSYGIENSSKEDMAKKVKKTEDQEHYKFIRFDSSNPLEQYSDLDKENVNRIIDKYLHFNPGYDYTRWDETTFISD